MNDRVDVDFGGWIQKGCNLWKDNALTLILAGALVFFIAGAPIGIIMFIFKGMQLTHPYLYLFLTTLLNIIPSVLLGAPLTAAYIKLVLAIHDKTSPKPEVTDVFQGFSMLMPAGTYVLIGSLYNLVLVIISFIGCLGEIIQLAGSLAFLVLTAFGFYFLVDKKMPVIDAYKASIEIGKKAFSRLGGLVVVAALIGASGVIACGIGIFATLPITFCIMAVAFRAITGGGPQLEEVNPIAAPPPIPEPSA